MTGRKAHGEVQLYFKEKLTLCNLICTSIIFFFKSVFITEEKTHNCVVKINLLMLLWDVMAFNHECHIEQIKTQCEK